MRITSTRHIGVSFTGPRISMLGPKGEAWDHLVYFGRVLEKKQPCLRAYQFHFFWINLSYWRTDCKPLLHGFHSN